MCTVLAVRPRRAAFAAVVAAAAIGLAAAPPSAHAAFGAPVVVTDADLGEPGIDAAPNGTLYVNAPTGLLSNAPGSPSDVFRSRDGGATWTLLPAGLKANLPGGGDSDIALDPVTGAIAETDLWLGSATVSRSTDEGDTWTANPLQGVVVQDRQWVAQAGGGVVYHLTHQIPAGLVVSKSLDGGLTYPLHSVGATPADQTGCICPPGTLIAENGSTLGLADKVGFVYATSSGGVKFARSTNGGATFSQAVVGPPTSGDTTPAFPVVANAGGGRLQAVWLEVDGTAASVVKTARSADWGATWSAPRVLVDAGASVYPWVAAQGVKVAVSLYHTASAGTPNTVPEDAAWFESYLESTDGGATFTALETVDPTPVKSGPICTEGVGCSGDRELLDFQSDTIDGQGRANLTWTRSIDGVADTELRFARQP
jgi:hypothetical protein